MDAVVSITNSTLQLHWDDVFNVDRDVTYSVYAGTVEDIGDVINHSTTKSSSYSGPFDASLRRLYINIQCVYDNGLSEWYRHKMEF